MSSCSGIRPSWQDWVERNAQPKQRFICATRPEPTRWQKAGPMTRNQWVSFYKWLEDKGGVKHKPKEQVKIKPKVTTERSRELIPGVFVCLDSQIASMQEKQEESRLKLQSLSQPKLVREKFIRPRESPPAYRPQLAYHPPPRPEFGRPRAKHAVPCCFQHEDIEGEFWATLRFPVSKNAMNAEPSQKIIELAKPRQYPPKQHCSIPDKKDKPPKRTKMTRKQFQEHLARLDYLSSPNPRVLADLIATSRLKFHNSPPICLVCGCRKRRLVTSNHRRL